jgi:hypothetical protein
MANKILISTKILFLLGAIIFSIYFIKSRLPPIILR